MNKYVPNVAWHYNDDFPEPLNDVLVQDDCGGHHICYITAEMEWHDLYDDSTFDDDTFEWRYFTDEEDEDIWKEILL